MNFLHIDLETFSSVPLNKAGLYKYVRSSDFQILLCGCSINDGPVQVLDLFTQKQDADFFDNTFKRLLFSSEYIKIAYNAPFEISCLAQYFNLSESQYATWLSQWRDTMLHGLYCGYTAGLAATGKALGLPEDKRKLSIGKALIKLFCSPCKPTARNGNRTRTLPFHEPEKWELFKT